MRNARAKPTQLAPQPQTLPIRTAHKPSARPPAAGRAPQEPSDQRAATHRPAPLAVLAHRGCAAVPLADSLLAGCGRRQRIAPCFAPLDPRLAGRVYGRASNKPASPPPDFPSSPTPLPSSQPSLPDPTPPERPRLQYLRVNSLSPNWDLLSS